MADGDEHPVVTAGRIGVAVVAVLFLFFVAIAMFIIGALTEDCGPSARGAECGDGFRNGMWIGSGVVFFGSGLVGWFIAGKRWMVLAPIVAIVGVTGWALISTALE